MTTQKQPTAYDELRAVFEDSSERNWDGYDAEPVSAASVENAERFLDLLPAGIPPPSIGAEPDGDITLDWFDDRGPNLHTTSISISVSPSGALFYSVFIGASTSGREAFSDSIPENILKYLEQLPKGNDDG